MNLLALDSSILENHSTSRQLMRQFLDHWQQVHPQAEIVYRDLNTQPINHLSSELLNAKQKVPADLSPSLKEDLELSEQLVNEFINADELVIAAPMYNFTLPSQLKAWIDRILVAGRTFKYTAQGVIGLAGNKKVTIISTRGNHYSSDEVMRAKDFQEDYLKVIFDFVGIKDVTIIRAEGLNINESIRVKSVSLAEQEINSRFQVMPRA
ncbi:FMN-dependent NADH-azoreductase [Legionella saoudiensis]|uniref:FMN-dependent NADH-azoreductase n=1 Tax=Legionella saoudiensis TaxID=1750561 RepID=UPI00073011C3|nr:NAD(P)H-dependent oxidoreductase [Legionella saoudiensis]